MKVFGKRESSVKTNIEIETVNCNQLGLNITDYTGSKTAWVLFSLKKAKEIKNLIDEYIKKEEQK